MRAQQAQLAAEELGLHETDTLKALLEELMQERQAFVNARKDSCERPLKAYLIDLNGECRCLHISCWTDQ